VYCCFDKMKASGGKKKKKKLKIIKILYKNCIKNKAQLYKGLYTRQGG